MPRSQALDFRNSLRDHRRMQIRIQITATTHGSRLADCTLWVVFWLLAPLELTKRRKGFRTQAGLSQDLTLSWPRIRVLSSKRRKWMPRMRGVKKSKWEQWNRALGHIWWKAPEALESPDQLTSSRTACPLPRNWAGHIPPPSLFPHV